MALISIVDFFLNPLTSLFGMSNVKGIAYKGSWPAKQPPKIPLKVDTCAIHEDTGGDSGDDDGDFNDGIVVVKMMIRLQ